MAFGGNGGENGRNQQSIKGRGGGYGMMTAC